MILYIREIYSKATHVSDQLQLRKIWLYFIY